METQKFIDQLNKGFAAKYIQNVVNRDQTSDNLFMQGQLECAKHAQDIMTELICEMVSKDQDIKKLKEAIKVFIIAVKEQDLTIFPASDTTPDYIQMLENLVKD